MTLLIQIGFIISIFGFLLWTKKTLDVSFQFIPVFVLSLITVVIYFGGIFNILYPVACLVYVIGILLFIWFGIIKHEENRYEFHLFDVCFLVGTIPFLFLLLNEHLMHYDNFTHWALIVKTLYINNAFPTSNTMIEFTNYPIGTSSLLYYFSRFLGYSDGILLFAQGLLIFSIFYAIFGAIERPKCFLLVATLGLGLSTLSFFNLTIRINNLLVDFILPILTLACFAIIDRYKDDLRKQLILLLPLQALLLIVKTTGIIYFMIIIVAWMMNAIKNDVLKNKKDVFASFSTMGLSLSTYILWNYHVSTVFSGVQNKFSSSSLASKSSEDVATIVNHFIQSSLDLSSRPFLGFLFGNLVIIILYFLIKIIFKDKWKDLLKSLFLLDFMVVLYYVGILGLYLFSMPLDEALTLAGFERYVSSIIVLFVGGLVLRFTLLMQEHLKFDENNHVLYKSPEYKKNYQKGIMACVFLIILILSSEYNGMIYNQSSYETDLSNTMKNVVGDHFKEDDDKLLLFGSDRDGKMTSYYFQYLAKYYLYAPNIDAVCVFYEPNLENLLSNYDYLVVVEENKQEEALLKKHFHVNGTNGFYHVVKKGNKIGLVKEKIR